MNHKQRDEYLTRENVMKLLSDDEVASVSTAETAQGLAEGDEYLDLKHLSFGVRRSSVATVTPMGRVLPRKAVQESTWNKIVRQLTPHA